MKVNPINLLGRDEKLSRTYSEKLSRIKIDKKLTFEEHIKGLCKKASQRVHTLARILFFMRFEQKKRIVNSFIISHFSSCAMI